MSFISSLLYFTRCPIGIWFAPRATGKKNNVKENNKENQDWMELKNNNYINSRNQTRSESGMDPFSLRPNSFLDNLFFSYIFIIILKVIRIRREGIHTGFWPGLVPGINIIIIFLIPFNPDFPCCFLSRCSFSCCSRSKSDSDRASSVIPTWFSISYLGTLVLAFIKLTYTKTLVCSSKTNLIWMKLEK